MFCKKCGNQMDDNEKFCKKCGAPVEGAEEQSAKAEKPKALPKTKLGLSVGVLAAIMYFCGLSGYAAILMIIIGGYILLAEENVFLRKSTIKALALAGCFMLLTAAVNFVPYFLNFLDNMLVGIFGVNFTHRVVSAIFSTLASIVRIVRVVFFVILGIFALKGKTIRIPVLDNLLDKYVK